MFYLYIIKTMKEKMKIAGMFLLEKKRYVLIIVAVIFFIVRGCSSSSTTQTITASDIYTVTSWTIENSIKVLWTTKITNQQTLTFQAAGGNGSVSKVSKLYVKEGDTVKAWQLLAELDKKDLKIQLSQQSLSLQNARISYNKLINQYDESDFIQAQKNIDDTKAKLDVAKKELEMLKSEEGDTVDTNSAKIQNILITTQNIINDGKSILDTIDEIFCISKTQSLYMNVQTYISAKNSQYKYSTESNYYTAKNKLTILEDALTDIQSKISAELNTVKELQTKSKDFLTVLYNVVDSAKNAVDNSVDGSDLSLSTIQSRSSTLSSASSKTLSYQNTVSTNISDLSKTDNNITNKKNEIKNYESQLQIYQNTLQDMQNGPDASDKQLQANSISQSALSYQKLSQTQSNYEIIAPFDGTVAAIDFKQGDNVDSTQWITVSNPNNYEINMLIDQVDIVKIDKWQEAEITFDAYPNYMVTGQITTIDPTPVTDAGVVSYYVKIALQKGEKKIYDGMTVTVNIIIQKKENVLYIPSTAIQMVGTGEVIQIIKWSDIQMVPITEGITDGINTEILSWLVLGDKVLLKAYTVTSTTTSNTTSNPFGTSANSSMRSMRALEWETSWWPSGMPRD